MVYIGFGVGSVQHPAALLQLIKQAVAEANLRAIVLWPQPVQLQDAWRERLLFIHEAPHAALFPRVQAVVHHGGAGTTAQAIRASVPSLVLPAMADQYFWGARVAALSVGPKPIPQRTLTVRSLVDGLRAATQTAAIGHKRAGLRRTHSGRSWR